MTPIDPLILGVLADLVRGLTVLQIDFCIIGALVPELLLGAQPPRATKDADATVIVDSLTDFEQLKTRLSEFGFARTQLPYRLTHRNGGRVDLLPYSKALVPNGHLDLTRDLSFNMAGFEHVMPNAIQVALAPDVTVPVAPLPLYALLKLVTFGDRNEPKDLGSVLHCLRHYTEDDDRRYGLDHEGESVPFEQTGAYLLGQDGRVFHGSPLVAAVTPVLDRFEGPDAPIVAVVAREDGHLIAGDEDRTEISDLFRWFRVGAGL